MAESKLTLKELSATPHFTRRSAQMAGTLTFAISTAMLGNAYAEEVALDKLVVEDERIAADSNPYAEPVRPTRQKPHPISAVSARSLIRRRP